ncbi:hypothetical protein BDC45DRAFT_503856 [Circinella umbellata]|nr:hypothetical protein BDC45DRAFT_503856 [Circinella umbellata]
MTIESDQDLPHELLEKLKNLELELEDGDITQKGFEKKKATLMDQFGQNEEQRQSNDNDTLSRTSRHSDNGASEPIDFGPEPSAADVVDFLDYLPSPTHSPPKPASASSSGAALMEQNHRQLQEKLPVQPVQPQVQPQHVQQQIQPQASYHPYPQQQQQQPQQQQWQQPPTSYGYTSAAGGNGTQYYHTGGASPRPARTYDSRMAPRPQYQQGPPQSSPSIRHGQTPYGYSQQPRPGPPPQAAYRQGPPPPNAQYRPIYTNAPSQPQQRPIPQQMVGGSPRPVYRTGTVTQQPIRPNNYRPVMPLGGNPAHMRTSSLDARSDMVAQPQQPSHPPPPRPGYTTYGAPPPRTHHMQPPPRNIPPEAWRGQ